MPDTGPGIGPLVKTEKAYEQALRTRILNPMVKSIGRHVEAAGADYQRIRDAIRAVDPAPPGLEPAAKSIAKANLTQIKDVHLAEFRRLMRRWFGVRVDLISDSSIDLPARILGWPETLEERMLKQAELAKLTEAMPLPSPITVPASSAGPSR
ncbi:MAG: hypothetical protein OXG37_05025 [Actinomycetia bacterium]|nr:hypothetical protein [Actinomycetes bacterium]